MRLVAEAFLSALSKQQCTYVCVCVHVCVCISYIYIYVCYPPSGTQVFVFMLMGFLFLKHESPVPKATYVFA